MGKEREERAGEKRHTTRILVLSHFSSFHQSIIHQFVSPICGHQCASHLQCPFNPSFFIQFPPSSKLFLRCFSFFLFLFVHLSFVPSSHSPPASPPCHHSCSPLVAARAAAANTTDLSIAAVLLRLLRPPQVMLLLHCDGCG
jgi:hypothetical protein